MTKLRFNAHTANMGNSFKALGEFEAACQNWEKAKEFGAKYVDSLIDKHCKR